MERISLLNPTKKLIFAEYLISRDDPEPFLIGAHRHILDASREVLMALTGLDERDIASQQITMRVLNKFDDPDPKKFFKFYLEFSKRESFNREGVANALNKVKEFIKWVEEYREKKD